MRKLLFYFSGALILLCACQTKEKVYSDALIQDSLKNYDEAINLYEEAASRGMAEAYYRLGNIYCDTVPGKTDSLKAFGYYKKADSLGVLEGTSQLGMLYMRAPKGIKADTIKAIKLIEKAGDRNTGAGYFEAAYYYSRKYFEKGRNSEDSLKLWQYAEKTIELEYPEAYGLLGYLYNTKEDYNKSLELLQKGVELNDSYSIYTVGIILCSPQLASTYNIEPDGKKGIELLKKVVDKYPNGAGSIGWVYENGFAVEADQAKATYWYKKAADAGNAVAQYDYANQLYWGRGCNVNKKVALQYYRLSAKQGYPDAINALKNLRF